MFRAEADLGYGYRIVEPGTPEWDTLIPLRPNPPVRCLGCAAPVTPYVSDVRSCHFRHLVTADKCVHANESEEHLRLKVEVAEAINQTGAWRAHIEHRATDGTYIADVLAESQLGLQSVAFEIQLSPQDAEWTDARHQRRELDGLDCVWIVGPKGRGVDGHSFDLFDQHNSIIEIARLDEDQGYNTHANWQHPPSTYNSTMGLAEAVDRYLLGDLEFVAGDLPMTGTDATAFEEQLEKHRLWTEKVEAKGELAQHELDIQAAVVCKVLPRLLARHGAPLRVGGDSETWALDFQNTSWDKAPNHYTINSSSDIDSVVSPQ